MKYSDTISIRGDFIKHIRENFPICKNIHMFKRSIHWPGKTELSFNIHPNSNDDMVGSITLRCTESLDRPAYVILRTEGKMEVYEIPIILVELLNEVFIAGKNYTKRLLVTNLGLVTE